MGIFRRERKVDEQQAVTESYYTEQVTDMSESGEKKEKKEQLDFFLLEKGRVLLK